MNTVIMVEKDSKLIINYKRMLEPYQKEIKFIYFMYPEEALEYIAQNSVSVLLSELDLPVMSGKELFDMVEMVSPTTIKIAMSQVIEVEKTLEIMNQSRIFKLILKPFFLVEDLLTPIQEAIKYYEHQEVEECYRRNVSLELEMLNKKSEELNQKLEEKKQSYTSVYDMAVGIVRTNLKYGKVPFTEEEESLVNKVFEGLFQEFMRYYMFEARNFIFHANYLKNMFHHPKEAQNFIIKSNTEKEIECKAMQKMAYTIFMSAYLCKEICGQYDASAIIEQEGELYVIKLSFQYPQDEYQPIISSNRAKQVMVRMVQEVVKAISVRAVQEHSGNSFAAQIYF